MVLCPGSSRMLYQDGNIKVEEPSAGLGLALPDRDEARERSSCLSSHGGSHAVRITWSDSHDTIMGWWQGQACPGSPMVREIIHFPSSSHRPVLDSVRSMTHLL